MIKLLILVLVIAVMLVVINKIRNVNNVRNDGGKCQHNGHEWVDLGLPSGLKWATCNVGATSPEDYGNYYAWGETATKAEYTKENSVTYGKSMSDISGNVNNDAATANWGGSWRTPTEDEMGELLRNCEWEWTTQNGVKGYKVTSRANGNSIFLPAAGFRSGSLFLTGDSYGGSLWNSTPLDYSSNIACSLGFNSDGCCKYHYDRYYGRSVRPVLG